MPNYICLRANLSSDPKVLQIAATLGIPTPHALGLLCTLWSWADGLGLDGATVKASGVVLDRLVGIPGFSQALRSVGWLEGEDGALVFPGLEKHSFKEAVKRERSAERVRKHRDEKRYTGVTGGVTEAFHERYTGVTDDEKPKPAKSRKPRKEKEPESEPSISADEFFLWFQSMARRKGLSVPSDLTDSRRKKILARLKDPAWFGFLEAGEKKLPLGGNWQPDLDWFLANQENVRKLADGKYDRWSTPKADDPRGNRSVLEKYLFGGSDNGDEAEDYTVEAG